MKKLLLILLCLPMVGFGQYQYKLDSITANYPISFNLPEITIGKIEYDSQGRFNKIIFPGPGDMQDSNGNIVYSYDYHCGIPSYNTNDQIISSQHAFQNSNTQNLDVMENTINFFDSNNNLISSESELTTYGASIFGNGYSGIGISSGIDGKNKITYTYNINNQSILDEKWDWDGSTYVPTFKTEKIWLSGGLSSQTIESANVNQTGWEISKKTNYSFVSGDLSNFISINYSNGVPNDTTDGSLYYNNALISNTAQPTGMMLMNAPSTFGFPEPTYQLDSVEVTGANFSYSYHYYYSAFTSTAIQEHTTNKELLKVTDLLGRETKGTNNEVLFYIYDDGTVEKRIIIE
jgi:hypothetical protein